MRNGRSWFEAAQPLDNFDEVHTVRLVASNSATAKKIQQTDGASRSAVEIWIPQTYLLMIMLRGGLEVTPTVG